MNKPNQQQPLGNSPESQQKADRKKIKYYVNTYGPPRPPPKPKFPPLYNEKELLEIYKLEGLKQSDPYDRMSGMS